MENFAVTQLRELISECRAVGYRIKIIYLARSVAGHAISAYRQRVKRHRETRSFSEWLQSYRYPAVPLAIKTAELNLSASTIWLNYDLCKHNLWPSFLQAAGLNPNALTSPDVDDVRINPSLTDRETLLMRELNTQLSSEAQSSLAGHALAHSGNQDTRTCITQHDLGLLDKRWAARLEAVNANLPDEQAIRLRDSSIEIIPTEDQHIDPDTRSMLALYAQLLRRLQP